jgi:uncharacterized protein
MIGVLPERIAPDQLAAAGGRLQGGVPLAALARLADLVPAGMPAEGVVEVDLLLQRDADARDWLQGTVQAQLRLQCERCQEWMEWPVDAAISLCLAANEAQAAELAEDVEYVIAGDSLALYDLIEDEIILALPLVARHPQGTECGDRTREGSLAESGERDNPFAILKTLKT